MFLEVEVTEETTKDGIRYSLQLGEGRAQIDVERAIFINDPDAVRFALENATDVLRFESQSIIYKELKELEENEEENNG